MMLSGSEYIRPKRFLNRQELRRYVLGKMKINPQANPNLGRTERRRLERETFKEVRQNKPGRVTVVSVPRNWFELLKENFLPQWALPYWPVHYIEQ